MENQITTITFFKFNSFHTKLWAFFMMQFAHSSLKKIDNQTFYKLMGSGKGLGFNPLPDWSVYCLIQVWNTETDSDLFLENSKIMSRYKKHSSEVLTTYMRNISSHGLWSGKNPFIKNKEINPENQYVAVITRATIKNRSMVKFWKYVPTSQKPIKNAKGLFFTKGIGEIPLKQMSTFSIWESVEDLKNFAYNSEEHKKAITLTKELKWYSEELFARFQPYKSQGTWQGKEWEFNQPVQ
jgi:hypothetical protein